jgi:hypothetical protein
MAAPWLVLFTAGDLQAPGLALWVRRAFEDGR